MRMYVTILCATSPRWDQTQTPSHTMTPIPLDGPPSPGQPGWGPFQGSRPQGTSFQPLDQSYCPSGCKWRVG